MRNVLVLVVFFVFAGSLVGCTTARIVNPRGTDGQGPESYPETETMRVTWWNAQQEKSLQQANNDLLMLMRQKDEGQAWHAKAMEAAKSGAVIAPPGSPELGGFPVLFLNDDSQEKTLVYSLAVDGVPITFTTTVPSHGQKIEYLQTGAYRLQVLGRSGKPERVNPNAKGAARYWTTFRVRDVPNFYHEERGYFGYVRTY